MKGTWHGSYAYNNAKVQKAYGFERTNFTIEIETVNGEAFEGIVNDDTATGGMAGTGKITGIFKDRHVSFQKMMPEGLQFDAKGNRKKTGKPHSTLYYTGIKNGNSITGTWKFRAKIAFIFGLIPIPYSPGSGTWHMTLQDNTTQPL